MQLFEKLKNRKIVQWTAGYFAVAWGLLEVLSFLSNQFAWPSLVVRSTTVIVGTGFLIALTLAWHHGDKGQQRVTVIELITLAVIVVAGGMLTFIVNLPKSDEFGDLEELGSASGPVTRMTIALPRDQRLGISEGGLPLAVSPDGKRIAYVAETEQGVRLAVRPFDSFEATVLYGTEGAMQPFFSPDGEWIGFFMAGQMRKVPIHGGEPITITTFEGYPAGATWSIDDTILYSHWREGLWLVPSSGGSPRKVDLVSAPASVSEKIGTELQGIGNVLEWPSFLPDGKNAIVTDGSSVLLLNPITGELRELIAAAGREARYLRSGFLVFTETGEHLRAVGFDPEQLEIVGQPFPVLDNVFRAPGGGAIFFDISRNGTLVYVTGGFERSLVLADSDGRMRTLTNDKRGFRWPRFSPQGDRIVVTVDPRPSEFWIYEVARGLGEKISTGGHNILPIWQTESGNIVHIRRRALRSIDPDNPNQAGLLYPEDASFDRAFYPTTSTTNDRIIAGNGWNDDTGVDIYAVTIGDSPTLEPHLRSPADEREPDISPDGKWIAYASNTTGRYEVFVQPFFGPGRRTRISRDGGNDPQWSSDGRKLFYRRRDYIMVVDVDAASEISVSEPKIHLRAELDTTQMRNWDVGPDDQIVLVESDPTTTREFQVVLNWFKAVQELAE